MKATKVYIVINLRRDTPPERMIDHIRNNRFELFMKKKQAEEYAKRSAETSTNNEFQVLETSMIFRAKLPEMEKDICIEETTLEISGFLERM